VLVVARVPATAAPDASTSDTTDWAGSTAAVKVTDTVAAAETPVAPLVGVRVAIVGADKPALVVKDHAYGAMTAPDVLDAVAVTVYTVDAASAVDGVNVAVVVVVVRAPATAEPPDGVSVSDTDEMATGPLKVALTVEVAATPVAFEAGEVEATETAPSVLNVDVNGAMAVPVVLDAVTVTVYEAPAANTAEGVNVAVRAEVTSVPWTAVPPGPVSMTDTAAGTDCPENVTTTGLVTATPTAPAAGVTDATDGAGTVPFGSPL